MIDAMAQKTLLKQIISKYGPLSVEMEQAFTADNESEDVKGAPIDVTPQEENLSDFLGEPTETELPKHDKVTGEVLEEVSFFEGNTTNIAEGV